MHFGRITKSGYVKNQFLFWSKLLGEKFRQQTYFYFCLWKTSLIGGYGAGS